MRTRKHVGFWACSLSVCLTPGIGLSSGQVAIAATKVFEGNTTGFSQTDWNYGINWNAPGIPASGDTVLISLLPDLVTPAFVLGMGTPTNAINELQMTSGSTLLLNNTFDLQVTDKTTITNSTLDISRWATFTTDKLDVTGSGIVEVNKALVIGTSATIGTNGSIVVGFGDDRTIHLSGVTATFVNNGTLDVDKDLIMSAASGGTYNLGGSGVGNVDIAANKTLTLTAPMTGSAFSGTMILGNNALFDSTFAWDSSGQIDTHGDAVISGGALTLSGSGVLNVLGHTGTYLPPGPGPSEAAIATDLIVNDTAQVNVTGSHELTLTGETTFNGGALSITSGVLTIDGETVFEEASAIDLGTTGSVDFIVGSNGDVTINQGAFDWTNTNQTVASGGVLTINTDDLGNGLERRSIIGGTLNINSLTPGELDKWNLSTPLEFEEGTALVRTSPIINGVELQVSGNSSGRIETNSYSDATINSPVTLKGGTSSSPVSGIKVFDEATLVLNGVTSISRFVNQRIEGNGVLTLNGDTTINNKVTFGGTGTLVIAENKTVTTGGNLVVLAVNVTNHGTLDPVGSDIRTLTIGDTSNDRTYTQSSTGALKLTIAGSNNVNGMDINNYDNIDITGDAVLAGTLDIELDSFTPSASISSGDVYEVMTWTGTLTGVFGTVLGQLQDSAVMLGLVYNANSLDIVTRIPGDLTGDGYVGVDDMNTVLGNWNGSANAGVLSEGDSDGDGFVGINDLNLVLGNWNAFAPPASASTLPEPATLALLSLGGLAVLRRTRD